MKKYYFALLFFIICTPFFAQEDFNNIEELDKKLTEIKYLDQIGRDNISELTSIYMENPDFKTKLDSAIASQQRIDVNNQLFVSKLLDSAGWPSGLSSDANLGIFYVIEHAGTNFMKKYAKNVEKAHDNKYIPSNVYAIFVDRVRMYNEKTQIYGSQTISINGVYYVWPVENADNVDEKRQQMGLPPIDSYLEPLKSMVTVKWDKKMSIKDMKKLEGYNLKWQ